MKKVLLLLTASFPYGNGEAFLETEIEYCRDFHEVLCVPCEDIQNKKMRVVDNSKVEIINLDKSNFSQSYAFKALSYCKAFFTKTALLEIISLIANRKFTPSRLKELLFFLSKGNSNLKLIKGILKHKHYKAEDEIVFYSYWMSYQAYVAIKLKQLYPNSKCITRAHGYDLYEYRRSNNYIPLREYILKNADKVLCISKDGMEYLKETYGELHKNIGISRLGTKDFGVKYQNNNRDTLKLVSCSYVIPLKRVSRIIDALALIKDIKISWTHYGEGVLLDHIREYAGNILPENVQYHLPGNVSNNDLMNIYRDSQIHAFINVSEAEGIPVTIMEAMSFGIPVIATEVGGVGEIVEDSCNGLLLKKDFKDSDLACSIENFYYMKDEEYMQYRTNARRLWNENYNAKTNYEKFYQGM